MTPYLPGDILTSGSDRLPGEILRGSSILCLGANRLADLQIGRFQNHGGLLWRLKNPVCKEGRETRIVMKADA